MSTGIVSRKEVRKAKKVHHCDACREPINPGDRYFYVSNLMTHEVDVDDEGRTVAIELPRSERSWHTMKFHLHHEEVAYV